ncbi:MAG: carboxypeptidase-like regulatory domain-containing protein [Flavobacteriaceae bacterium]|nr:carboxypeptidase-like regulatory domain-containing protein [Flavobacteriaceae bacterium]
MKKAFVYIFFLVSTIQTVRTQNFPSVKGKIINEYTENSLEKVQVIVLNTDHKSFSDQNGNFRLNKIPIGDHVLEISFLGYITKKIPLSIEKKTKILDLGIIRLIAQFKEEKEDGYILLSDEDLYENEKGESNSITGLLTSSKDVFLKTVAYEFSPTFFKLRNLGSEYSEVLLNGVKMNKLFNGRPQWSNWGGLNDVLRNQVFTQNMKPSNSTFSGINGSTNLLTKASTYRKGVKISYAVSNRSYKGRVMASYSSGLLKNGWAYTFSASKRYAKEGFRNGTVYDANSFFISAEKIINTKHSINFTGIYASNIRGKSSPNTQEVYDLKDIKYNAYWGDQEEKMRNSRLKKITEPILQLNHYWNINSKTALQTNITYQFGKVGNSRLDYGGARIIGEDDEQTIIGGGTNPDPSYYQKLPSYFLRDIHNPDYENAYLAEQEFIKNGQINWLDLYESNQNSTLNNGNSIYALYEDRNDDKQLIINSILTQKINKNFTLNTSVQFQKLRSENFAYMLDLLGGNGFLDVDIYAENMDEAQSDLQNPNRIILTRERFKYNFNFDVSILNGFIQSKYASRKTDAFLAINYSNSNYQRTGFYENGAYPGNISLGKSEKLQFHNFSVKSGVVYKLTGRHIISANAAYGTKPPTLQNSFSNARENNDIVIGLTDEKISAFDLSYNLRHPKINAKLTLYGISLKDQTNISFYFADGLTGIDNSQTTAFVQEVLTGIDKQNFGLELGIEIPIISGLKFKGVAAIGQSIYSSNPNLYLTSDDFSEPLNYGEVSLKNYFVSNGPQQAYSIGFEYNSPNYWWFGITGNYFNHSYINIAPINRTGNFYLDSDGLPINDYDENVAKELLKQEKFKPYYLVNIVGGKSWKINDYYIGFFVNVGNILNTAYKTGGFEQSRNANYNTLLEDKTRDKPLFGPKYWYGYGTSYYTSVYFRF